MNRMDMISIWKQEGINSKKNTIKRLRESNKPVKVFGSGRYATFAARQILDCNLCFVGFIDDEKYYEDNKTIEVGG